MAESQEQFMTPDRTPLAPWTEIPFIPLPARDPTQGGQFMPQGREINIGDGGANVFRVDRQGMWLGAKTYDNAPFKVSMLGALVATSLSIVGGSIVGAVFKTAEAGARVVIDGAGSTKRLYTVDSAGNEVVTIYADSGAHGIVVNKASGSNIENCVRILDSDADVDDSDNGTVLITVSPGAASQKAILYLKASNSDYEGQMIKLVSSGTHDALGKQMIDISPGDNDARVLVIGSYSSFHIRGDGRILIKTFEQASSPTTSDLDDEELAVWVDSDDNSTYLIINQNSTIKKVQFT